jgi:putative chitinase
MNFDSGKFFDGIRSAFGPLNQGQVDGLNVLLGLVQADADATDVRYVAYELATIKHECANTYQPITELGSRSYFDKYDAGTPIGQNLGNTQPGDGYLFRGRGFVQLTGRANYQKMTQALGLPPDQDLVANPDLALQAPIAYQIMVYGMGHGSFTGKKISDYIHDDVCDFVNARRVINALDQAQKIAGYATDFLDILNAALVPAGQ